MQGLELLQRREKTLQKQIKFKGPNTKFKMCNNES